jgi:alkylation response protein AidB-like acyl-CoA dehydrogenase
MDLALDEQQQELRDAYERFFGRESTMERVRAAEPAGFDAALWSGALDVGIPAMGLFPEHGGATAVDLVLLAELAGRHLASIPVVETLCAVRLLDRLLGTAAEFGGQQAIDLLAEATGNGVAVVAVGPVTGGSEHYVPAGGVATMVLASVDDRLLVFGTLSRRVVFSHVHGSYPLGRWTFDPDAATAVLLESGGDAALTEVTALWHILSGAALMGMARRAIEIGSAYATERRAFGSPIGSFQGVAHPLADSATDVDGGELLVRRAAWLLDSGLLDEAAFQSLLVAGFCGSAATRATTRAVHIHGGYGAALDYDIQLFHQRARARVALIGDPTEYFRSAGSDLLRTRSEHV